MGYRDVPIPTDKNPKDYTYIQRRAEILKLIIAAGHPDAVSQIKLTQRYKKSPSQICQDFKAIAKDVAAGLGSDAKLITDVVFRKASRDLMDGNLKEKAEAARIIKLWNDWLFDIGAQQKAAMDIKIEGRVTHEDFATAVEDKYGDK